MVNGVWQFCPSHDLVNLDGMVITYSRFDTRASLRENWDISVRFCCHGFQLKGAGSSADQSYEIVYLQDYLPSPQPRSDGTDR